MLASLLLIYELIAVVVLVAMLPTIFSCVGRIGKPWASGAWRDRGVAFSWIILMVLMALLWPVALLFALWEWRSMK